jgi:hypothetical protein
MKIRIPYKKEPNTTVFLEVSRVVRNNERKKKEKLIRTTPSQNDKKGMIYDLMAGEYEIYMEIRSRKKVRRALKRIEIQETTKPEIINAGWSGDFDISVEVL